MRLRETEEQMRNTSSFEYAECEEAFTLEIFHWSKHAREIEKDFRKAKKIKVSEHAFKYGLKIETSRWIKIKPAIFLNDEALRENGSVYLRCQNIFCIIPRSYKSWDILLIGLIANARIENNLECRTQAWFYVL